MIPGLSKLYNKVLPPLYNSNPMQKAVKWACKETTINGKTKTNLDNFKTHVPGICALWITGFYMLCTAKEKSIPKERKRPLILNNLITGVLGAGLGYTVSGAISKFTGALEPRFKEIVKDHSNKINLIDGLKTVAPFVGVAVVFRYICPVIGTPAANALNNFLMKHNILSDPSKKPETKQQKDIKA